jgi:hypothetical protein
MTTSGQLVEERTATQEAMWQASKSLEEDESAERREQQEEEVMLHQLLCLSIRRNKDSNLLRVWRVIKILNPQFLFEQHLISKPHFDLRCLSRHHDQA